MIASSGGLAPILFRWKDWAGEGGPKKFVEILAKRADGAITVLKAFLSRSTSHGMGDYIAREHWYINLKSIETFIPWQTIETVVRDVLLDTLPNEDRRAVEAFRRAIERRRRGKPDFGEGFDFDDE